MVLPPPVYPSSSLLLSPFLTPGCVHRQACERVVHYAHLPVPPSVVERVVMDDRAADNLHGGVSGLFDTMVAFFSEPSVARAGVFYYVVGFVLLTAWDYVVVPWLQDHEILAPLEDFASIRPMDALTYRERKLPWITVLTADQAIPLPGRTQLQSDPDALFFIGHMDTVTQFITLAKPEKPDKVIKGEYDYSKEWSIHYNLPVYIVKKRH